LGCVRQSVHAQLHVGRPDAGARKPQRWYDEGYLKKADTIEDLARQLNIDAARLRATVERQRPVGQG
jgi:hypothetical protein